MTRAPATFKPSDLTKVIKAIEKSGLDKPYRIEIDANRKPVVFVGGKTIDTDTDFILDQELAEFEKRVSSGNDQD